MTVTPTRLSHPTAALTRAQAAAERAITSRLLEAGWPVEVAEGLGRVAAEIATDAAWGELKRANRPRLEDGR